MYRIIDFKSLIFLIIVFYIAVVAVVGGGWLLVSDSPVSEIWPRILSSSTTIAATMLLFLANNAPFFRFIWGLYSKISKDAFPDLSGEWEVELQSNYPVYLAIADAAQNKDRNFDVFSPGEVEKIKLKQMRGTGTIKVTFIEISIQTKFDDGVTPPSESHTLVASPIKKTNGTSQHQLTYVYVSKRRDTQADDVTEHHGAAWIDLTGDGENLTLEGNYWTKRNWRRAGNTAGRITFSRSTV